MPPSTGTQRIRLVGLEHPITLDAALDLGAHAKRIGQAELEPARDTGGRHTVVEQLVGAAQQRIDGIGVRALLDGTLGQLGQVPRGGSRLKPVAQR